MKVLLTGCAGFIGWKVCKILLNEGHIVTGVDNLNDAYDPRLKDWRLAQEHENPNFNFQRVDIADRREVALLGEQGGWEAVINLAARAGVRQSVEDPWCYYETNVVGNLNLLDLCRRTGISKFVLSSTSSVYGESLGPYTEDMATDRPLSPYAASKKAAELACYTYHQLHGLDVSVLRYFTVYGPAGRPDMSIFRFVKRISQGKPITVFGDGSQQRDFTYVGDIARGTVASLKPLGFETINLGSDRPLVLRDVICQIEEGVGRQAEIETQPRHPADVSATWAQINKANELLDWRPQVFFKEGLAQAISWYQENEEWAGQLLE